MMQDIKRRAGLDTGTLELAVPLIVDVYRKLGDVR